MGWDAHVVSEYKDGDVWRIAQPYTTEKYFDYDQGTTEVKLECESLWGMYCQRNYKSTRNYNLFRILAGIRNTQEAVDREYQAAQQYKNDHEIYHYLIPETLEPVTPLAELQGGSVGEDISDEVVTIMCDNCCDRYHVVITLQQIEQFLVQGNNREIYHELRYLYEDIVVQYGNICRWYQKAYDAVLTKDQFRIVVGFNV